MPSQHLPRASDPAAAVAIVGMACTYPGARNLSQFWDNILNKVDAVTEVTPWTAIPDSDEVGLSTKAVRTTCPAGMV